MDNFLDKLAQKLNAQEMIKANSQAEAVEMNRLRLQVSEYEMILQEMRKLNYKNTELSERMDALIGDNADKINAMREDERKLIDTLRDLADEQTRNREAQLERLDEKRFVYKGQAQEKSEIEQKIMDAIKNLADEQARNCEVQLERLEEERLERERQAQEKSENEQKLMAAIKNLTDEQTRNREVQLERLEEERLERERQAQEKAENDAVAITELLEEKFQQSDDFIHKENVKVYRNVQAVVIDEIKRQNELNEQENRKLKSKLNAVVTVSIVSIIVSLGTIALCALTLLTTMGIRLF